MGGIRKYRRIIVHSETHCKFSLRKWGGRVVCRGIFPRMHEGILELSPNSPAGLLELPFEEGSFPIWQTEFWNRFLLRSGWTDRGFFVYVGAIDDPDVAGYFELRSIGLGQTGVFCVGGPFFQTERRLSRESDVFEKNALFEFSRKLRNLASSCGALFVQYEPLVEVDFPGFRKGEYRHFLEKSTLLLDLRSSEDEILSQMKEKGRYNVRLAQKRGVSVRFSDGNDSDVETFFRLLSETLSRDGFSGNSLEYYRELVRALTSEGIGGLFIAEKDGESVAAAIATFI